MAQKKETKGTKTIKKVVKKATVKKVASEKVVKKTAATKLEATAQTSKRSVTVNVIDMKGKVVESMSLPAEIFAAKVNPTLMAQAVRVYLANQRRGTVATKTRGEVDGSTRKIYRQKGTGRARHGSVRAPIFVGGGLVFGPKPRDYSMSLPRKMRRAALFSALTAKLNSGELKVIRGLEGIEPKTKVMYAVLKEVAEGKNPSVLLVIPSDGRAVANVTKAVRNIEGVSFLPANQLNTYAVLRAKQLLLMKGAVEHVTTVFSGGNKS